MLERIRKVFRDGVFSRKFVLGFEVTEKEVPLFYRLIKKGMYLRHRKRWAAYNLSISNSSMAHGHWPSVIENFNYEVYEERCPYMLVTEVLVDETGRFKFQYIGPTDMGWTEWLIPDVFNIRYEVKNPWI